MFKLGLVCGIKGFELNLLEYMFQAMREWHVRVHYLHYALLYQFILPLYCASFL